MHASRRHHLNQIEHRAQGHYDLFKITLMVMVSILVVPESALSRMTNSSSPSWELKTDEIITIDSGVVQKGYLLSPSYPATAPINITATVLMQIQSEQGNGRFNSLRLSFIEFNLEATNSCVGESLAIYRVNHDDEIDPNQVLHMFCGSALILPVQLTASRLVVRFVSDEFSPQLVGAKPRGFKLMFEFVSQGLRHNHSAHCAEFTCRNRHCIAASLLCNGVDDCGDASDEDGLTPCAKVPTIPYSIDYTCGLAHFERLDLEANTGINQLLLLNRIVGGSSIRVQNKRLPQVSIQLTPIEPVSHICGGVLIHPLFVLASAHCFREVLSPLGYKLLFGLQDLRSATTNESTKSANASRNSKTFQLRYASSIAVYPDLSRTQTHQLAESVLDKANKLALIELNAPIQLNEHVWPACLPHLGEPIQAERECQIAGYGETRGSGHSFKLKQTIQIIQSASDCRSSYSNVLINDYSMICAQNQPGQGPCNGDSGGPLLCRDDWQNKPVNVSEPHEPWSSRDKSFNIAEPGELFKFLTISEDESDDDGVSNNLDAKRRDQTHKTASRYTVHGITSFTTDGNMGGGFCALSGVPIVYGRVSTRIEWILAVMKAALDRLNKADQSQDKDNQRSFFGYMFRTGQSQHENFTRLMTIEERRT